jgi:alkylated DNA repair dioxygenase AlkB
LYVQQGEQIPAAVVDYFKQKFAGTEHTLEQMLDVGESVVWVVDPVTDFLLPIGFEPRQLQGLNAVLNGADVADHFSASEIEQLLDYRVLVDQKEIESARAEFVNRIEASRLQLANSYYTVFKSPFSLAQKRSQSDYFSAVANSGVMKPNCVQVPNRKFIHNEQYCRFLHYQLNSLLMQISEQQTKPSYSFLAHYLPGAILKKHIDREQCEWNVSMPFYVNEGFDKPWPIYLQLDINDENSVVKVELDLGDMVIYSGSKLYHWREMLEKGKESSICFFHFVDADFKGDLD